MVVLTATRGRDGIGLGGHKYNGSIAAFCYYKDFIDFSAFFQVQIDDRPSAFDPSPMQ
jgi:hypothetical protein